MAEYRNFDRCIICRSRDNLKKYHGEYQETMLINTLCTTVMFPIEARQSKGTLKAKRIAKYLRDNCRMDFHGNKFGSDDIVRCLRNALAHFNVDVECDNGEISSMRLWAINRAETTICKKNKGCNVPKCTPKQYKEGEKGEICTFYFSMPELRAFVDFVINHALDLLPDNICKDCELATV